MYGATDQYVSTDQPPLRPDADVLAARFGTRGMLATDLFTTLQRIVNPDVIDVYHDESSNSTT